jgi:hypothetical protein
LEVGRNAKVAIAAVVVIVLLGITFVADQMLLTIAVAVIGGIGIFFLLRQEEDDDDGDDDDGPVRTKRDPKAKTGKARLDEFLDDQATKTGGTTPSRRTPSPAPPASGGLPTWTPGSLDAGTPSVDDLDSSADASWDTWEKEWPQGEDGESLLLDDDDPLGALDQLDDIDPVAEVERIEERTDDDPFASLRSDIVIEEDSFELDELDDLAELDVDLVEEPTAAPAPAASSSSAFSFAAAPAVINEEVSTADDIMAASTATELHVEDAGDSELARLLAKVQARLSAYE